VVCEDKKDVLEMPNEDSLHKMYSLQASGTKGFFKYGIYPVIFVNYKMHFLLNI